jgi:hypothetical protein
VQLELIAGLELESDAGLEGAAVRILERDGRLHLFGIGSARDGD